MKIVIIIIAIVSLLIGASLLLPKPEVTEPSELVISAYLFDESIVDPNDGLGDTYYSFEALELNKPRLMAPLVGAGMYNLCIYLEYEGGVVEVVSESYDVQLSISSGDKPWSDSNIDKRRYSSALKIGNSGYMNLNPLGSGCGELIINDDSMYSNRDSDEGREYFLSVNAYDFSDENAPVISAVLCLTQLHDDAENTYKKGASRFFSIELISYKRTESDILMDGGLFNE